MVSSTDPLGHANTTAYDALDRLASTANALAETTTYTYDAASNLVAMTDPLGQITQFTLDTANRQTQVTDPLNHATTSTLDAAGQVITTTNALNYSWHYTYGSRGWVESSLDPNNSQTVSGYNAAGDRTTHTLSSGQGGSGSQTSTQGFDALHRQTSHTDPLFHTVSATYDVAGNNLTETDALGNTRTYTYDARNRETTASDPLGNTTQYSYDLAGNRVSATDPLGRTTTWAYDAQNRVGTTTDPRGAIVEVAYDLAGRAVSIKDPVNNLTTYQYDGAGRVTIVTDPLGATTTNTYDAAGQLQTQVDRNGRRRDFIYDGAGKLMSEIWKDASGTTVRTLTWTYDMVNQLTGASDPDSAYAYTYDSGGRLTSSDNMGTPGVPRLKLTYSYDTFNNRTGAQDTMGGTRVYVYDQANRLTELRYQGPPGFFQASLTYDAGNRLAGIARGNGGSPQVTSSFAYDNASRLTTLTHVNAQGMTLSSFAYGYNASGEVTTYTGPDGTLNYAYDASSELTGVTGARTETYTYDLNGNRTMSGYATGANNRLASDGIHTYVYDAEGNLQTRARLSDDQVLEFTWDHRNRLTKVLVKDSAGAVVQESRFTYDVFDRRIGKWVDADGAGPQPGTQVLRTVYDGQNPYADFPGQGGPPTRYLYGPAMDWLVARLPVSGTAAWFLTDRLASVRQVVSTSGSVLDELTYDSYGQVLTESDPSQGGRFAFTGRERDTDTGHYYYRARYYSPAPGTFIAEDPVSFRAGDPNLYRYVMNSPVNATDPEGLWIHIAGGIVVGAVIGGAAAAIRGGDAGAILRGAGIGAVVGGVSAAAGLVAGNAAAGYLGSVAGGLAVGIGVGCVASTIVGATVNTLLTDDGFSVTSITIDLLICGGDW